MKTPITGWVMAAEVIEEYCESCCEKDGSCKNDPICGFPEWVADRARDDERLPDIAKKVLAEAEKLHPYKEIGNRESYSDYNQGWADAIDFVSGRMGIDY